MKPKEESKEVIKINGLEQSSMNLEQSYTVSELLTSKKDVLKKGLQQKVFCSNL